MITLPPYISDAVAYHQLPIADRWIMNKLAVAERLGYACGPAGVNAPAGKYVVRPMMNVLGHARGGFYSHENVVEFRTHMIPGYFWSEWFDGPVVYTSYIDDEPVAYSSSTVTNKIMSTDVATKTRSEGAAMGAALPAMFRDISKYMMTESIGGNIVEVCPRLMFLNGRQFIIDDYKAVDSKYDPVASGDVVLGNSDSELLDASWDAGDGNVITGSKWGNVHNQRPF